MSNYANSNPENWDYMNPQPPDRTGKVANTMNKKTQPNSLFAEAYTATLECMYHSVKVGDWGTASECATVLLALRDLRK